MLHSKSTGFLNKKNYNLKEKIKSLENVNLIGRVKEALEIDAESKKGCMYC